MQEKFMFQQIVPNFSNFKRNNSVFMQKNHAFKKYLLQRKLIFQQLVTYFADFAQNNNVFMEKKNCTLTKKSSARKIYIYAISAKK